MICKANNKGSKRVPAQY